MTGGATVLQPEILGRVQEWRGDKMGAGENGERERHKKGGEKNGRAKRHFANPTLHHGF